MDFERKETSKKAGIITGYSLMFLIFSIILYFIITYIKKTRINFFTVLMIALFITLSGNLIKLWVKK